MEAFRLDGARAHALEKAMQLNSLTSNIDQATALKVAADAQVFLKFLAPGEEGEA